MGDFSFNSLVRVYDFNVGAFSIRHKSTAKIPQYSHIVRYKSLGRFA